MRNNFDIKKLISENMAIAVTAAVAVTLFIIYIIVFAPLLKMVRVKYAECKNCENQVVEARNLIVHSRDLDEKYGGRVLMSEEEAASAIDELAKHGKSLGIDIVSMKPLDIIKKEGTPYKIMPVEMQIESSGEKFVEFLGSVDELEKALIRLNSFEVFPDTDDRTRLKAKLILGMYLSLNNSE